MNEHKKEELLTLFTISLALIACSVLVYMARTPSISGNAALENFGHPTAIAMISLLILIGIAAVISAIIHVHNMHKETEKHKQAIGESKEIVVKHNPELADYISKARQYGFKKHHILKKLKENSWKEKEIKKHLK